MRKALVVAVALGFCFALCPPGSAQPNPKGQNKAHAAKSHTVAKAPMRVILDPSELKWGPAPPSIPAGAQMVVLQGDPGKTGMFTLRIKTPDGFKIPAHWHPAAEQVTVLSGVFHLGTGDLLDESKATSMAPGAFATMPARMHHFGWTTGETVVQVSGMGPFEIHYVNPADDPRSAAK